MLFKFTRFIPFLLLAVTGFAQSPSFETYMNPVIPGDHPDPTLFKWGDHFFTTRSSFNTTPKIYHSTDLVHWEVSSKPIDPGWSELDDCQACGIWGGSIEYFAGYFWEYFGLKSDMWFVKAESPFGPWSEPVRLIPPPSATEGFGRDNSIFVDDDGTAYLLAKPGQQNNQIFKLRADGQCTGEKIDLGWMNPAPDYPLGWAEGPVMCKKDGYYYYFIAENAAGGQYVYRTQTLTEDESAWEFMGSVFNYSDRSNSLFYGPNHMSYPVELEDGTWWTILHSWQSDWNTNEWQGQGGRQGLLSQVYWDENGKPTVQWPVNRPLPAPDLPSSGIPWMVPKSDFFESAELHAGWEFFGRTPASMYSLSDRPGWFRMKPGNRLKSLVKNDAEHAYALLTRVDFEPTEKNEEAGLRITNGLEGEQNIDARLHSGYNGTRKVIRFKFQGIQYETENTAGNTVWLRIVRSNHILTGYFSADGMEWTQVGNPIDVSAMDENQPDYNGWLGNRQGIYAENKAADFDLYIYRDAYSPIMAHSPANQLGTSLVETGDENFVRGGIHDQDWVLYPGVEFGNMEYTKLPAEAVIEAASASDGGRVEIWVDSIGTGTKIGECSIENTGGWNNYQTFTSRVKQITGRHDVYLHFKGGSDTELLRLKSLQFISKDISAFRSAKLEEPSVVQLQLTVPVNLPEESVSGLTVNVNHTPINITNYTINESDSTWMIIQIENPVDSADLVTISYQEGNLYTNDSAYLKPFENKLVDNLLPGSAPRLVFAETNMEGTTIEATFNKPMEVPDSSYKFFSISTGAENPESIDITSVSNKDNDPFTLVLQPKQTLYAEYHIALNYSGSSLSSFDGGRLAPVTGFQVKNNAPGMPLTIVSSTIQNGGLSVALEFNKTLQAQSGQEAYFAVKVNGAIYQVQEITFSQSTLSILTDIPIRHGDTVFVTYAGGEISAIDGGILSDFTDKAITNNLPSPNYQHIPGKIEAESAVINNRAAIINATDTAGGYVAGYVDGGDYFDFAVNIKESGTYTLSARMTSPYIGTGIILQTPGISSFDQDTMDFPNTGSWNNWNTIYSLTNLDAGNQYLRVYAVAGEFNLNWLNFQLGDSIPRVMIDTAIINESFDNISLVFNKELKSIRDAEPHFNLSVDNETHSIANVSLSYRDKKNVILTLDNPIAATAQNITLTYDGFGLEGFDNAPVSAFSYTLKDFSSGIAEQNTKKQFSIYPNPVTNRVTIKSSVPYRQIIIADLQGKMLINNQVHSFEPLKTMNLVLPAGQYVIYLVTADGKLSTPFIVR